MLINDIPRFLKLYATLLRTGVNISEDAKRVRLAYKGNVFSFIKETEWLKTYEKLIASFPLIMEDNGLHLIEVETEGRYGQISYASRKHSIEMVFDKESKERFFGDIYHITNEFDGYLQQYRPKEGDVVIDAGAYHGLFAVMLSKKVAKIICVEPDEENARIITKNILTNKCENIAISVSALWDKDEEISFSATGTSLSSCTGEITTNIDGRTTPAMPDTTVSGLILGTIMKRHDIDKVDFIKMDIEGAEIEAINGCKNILKRDKPELAIASYHIRNNKHTSEWLEHELNNLGYNTVTGFPIHPTTYARWK